MKLKERLEDWDSNIKEYIEHTRTHSKKNPWKISEGKKTLL